ncbi:hypothetical protein HWB52_gp07 [Pseudomonas phage Littlefix]|uniref:Uncharacterized protein n=1 Tax=Pseudomonas phage Littlefix TaxID=2079289 RepID=A0A2K9VHR7_9CAUD|nr:hypothetical protein HWB52_gp07 [Pseudomonas phage Littlefix]AUV61822.1 hypothetical protein PsPhLittlefix_gp07 [Pseudomonas phage Littlefix]
MSKAVLKHWYIASFMVQHPGLWVPTSFVFGLEEMGVTIADLHRAKHENNVPENSVIIAVSYLGFKTNKAMQGLPDIDPPTEPSEKFKEGMVAAIKYVESDSNPILNPYSLNPDNDPQLMHDADEWNRGYRTVRTSHYDPKYDTAKPMVPTVHKEQLPSTPQKEAVKTPSEVTKNTK